MTEEQLFVVAIITASGVTSFILGFVAGKLWNNNRRGYKR